MKPTIPWIRQAFAKYNKEYFGGALKTPSFTLNSPPGTWAFYEPDGTFNGMTRKVKLYGPGTIKMNSAYSRNEKDLISALLHEMIHMYIITVNLKYPKQYHGAEFQTWANKLNAFGWDISEYNEKKETDTKDDTPQEEYDNRTIKPSIFCVLEQPNNSQYKVWGFRAEYANLNQYIQSAKNLKKYGATQLYIFYCYSENMSKMPSSPQDLRGVGASNLKELVNNLSTIIGEKFYNGSFELQKRIAL